MEVETILKDKKGFEGFEMAVALITLVIAAGVFIYMLSTIGFFLIERSQEATNTGIEQTTPTVKLSGKMIANGIDSNTRVGSITIYLQNEANGEPVDLNSTVITYSSQNSYQEVVWHYDDGTTTKWLQRDDSDSILVEYELVMLIIPISETDELGPNENFILEVKPPFGKPLKIVRTMPSSLGKIMSL